MPPRPAALQSRPATMKSRMEKEMAGLPGVFGAMAAGSPAMA